MASSTYHWMKSAVSLAPGLSDGSISFFQSIIPSYTRASSSPSSRAVFRDQPGNAFEAVHCLLHIFPLSVRRIADYRAVHRIDDDEIRSRRCFLSRSVDVQTISHHFTACLLSLVSQISPRPLNKLRLVPRLQKIRWDSAGNKPGAESTTTR